MGAYWVEVAKGHDAPVAAVTGEILRGLEVLFLACTSFKLKIKGGKGCLL
jgi:hypothetical protein